MSLAGFLQLPMVSTKVGFRTSILGPLSGGGPDFAKPLRTYLEAYCLRRSERCLNLPASRQQCVSLRLSPEEQRLYDALVSDTKRQIDTMVSNGDKVKCNTLFTAMVKMRMLCNRGTFYTVEDSIASPGKLQPEIRCGRCSAMDEDNLMLLDSCAFCPDCGRPLQKPSPLSQSTESQRNIRSYNRDVVVAKLSLFQPGGFSMKLSVVVQNVLRAGLEAKRQVIYPYLK